MTESDVFFIYLLENYAQYKGCGADKVLKKLQSLNLVDLIHDMYWRYHSEALENAFDDIDQLILERENRHE